VCGCVDVSVCVCDHCPEVIKRNPLLTVVYAYVESSPPAYSIVVRVGRDGLRPLRSAVRRDGVSVVNGWMTEVEFVVARTAEND